MATLQQSIPTTGGGPIAALLAQVVAYQAIPSSSPGYGDAQGRAIAASEQLIDTLMATGHINPATVLALPYTVRQNTPGLRDLVAKVASIQAAANSGTNSATDLIAAQMQLVDALMDEQVLTPATILAATTVPYIGAAG